MPLEGRVWDNRLVRLTPLREVIPSPSGTTPERRRMVKKLKPSPCPVCGVTFDNETLALGHRLVAHPVVDPTRRKRVTRARKALAVIHRRLEEMGLSELQAHQVIRALAEELRKAGIT